MTADQLLQEAIIELQKRDLTPETRHVVDEAARLLLDGRDIEARALIEKAQAIAISRTASDGEPPQTDQLLAVKERMAPTILSRFGGRLALQIESVLNETVEELFRDLRADVAEAAAGLESQLADLQSRLQLVSTLQARVDMVEREMASSSAAAREESQLFVSSLEEMNQAHRNRVDDLREHLSARMENFMSQLAAQDERVNALSGLAHNLSGRMLSVEAQIERNTSWLREIQERQAKRAAALSAVLEGISKLRDAEPCAHTGEAG